MAFVDECKMVANFLFRNGNAYTTNNFLSFLEDTISRLKYKKVILLRVDSSFYGSEIFDYLENTHRPNKYIIVARHYSTIQPKFLPLAIGGR